MGLSAAILTKNAYRVASLIQLGADVNSVDKNGRTPLMIAVLIDSVEIVEMLLAAGAKPEFMNDAGETALSTAKSRDVERIIRRAIVVARFSSLQKPVTQPLPIDPVRPVITEERVAPQQIKEVIKEEEIKQFPNQRFKRTEGLRYFIPAMFGLCLLILIMALTWPRHSNSSLSYAAQNLKSANQMIKTEPEKHQLVQENEIVIPEEPDIIDPISQPKITKLMLTSSSIEKSQASITPRISTDRDEAAKIRLGHALNSQGFSLIQLGRPGDAIPVLEKSLRSFPEGTNDVHYAYAMFNLGVAWRKAGRPDIAIPILEKRMKIDNQRNIVARELNIARQEARDAGFDNSQN
jgi:tetratricopeptide (TPR) repeat protein